MGEDSRKDNVCPMCKGKKVHEHLDQKVSCVCGDGTYIGYLIEWRIEMLERSLKQSREDNRELQDWVKSTSKCKTCGGDQWKTLGLLNCKECDIPGKGFWPG
jgi:hypothetical protein